MPLYDYTCKDCGAFQSYVSMKRYAAPASCPNCGANSPRRMSVPFVASLSPTILDAHFRNEKSAEEPVVMSRAQFKKTGHHLHDLLGQHAHDTPDARHNAGHGLEEGLRSHTSPDRPWLLGH